MSNDMLDFVNRLRECALKEEDITIFGTNYISESKLIESGVHIVESGVHIGTVKPFPDVKADKEQVLKILEEAAEVFSAWEDYMRIKPYLNSAPEHEKKILNECADLIQATCNLISALGGEGFEVYKQACFQRNLDRGRYDNHR